MSSREIILNRVKNNKPKSEAAAKAYESEVITSNEQLLNIFTTKLEKSGAVVSYFSTETLKSELNIYAEQENVVRQIPLFGIKEAYITSASKTNHLNKIQTAVLEAFIGVAENGAMYIDESALPHRAVPFITQDLILVLSGESVVANMHEAYKVVDIKSTGYGLFIAGPSKTADIEQSLVIGAHGAKSLRVFIY